MTEKSDPPKTDNNQPPQGEIGGENKDSPSPRLPVVSEGSRGSRGKDIASSSKTNSSIEEKKDGLYEILSQIANRIINENLNFYLFSITIFVVFVVLFLGPRTVGNLEIFVVALVGVCIFGVTKLAIRDKRINDDKKEKEDRNLLNTPNANTRLEILDLPLHIANTTEYKIFKDQFEWVFQKNSNPEFDRQIDKKTLQYFLLNNQSDEQLIVLLEKGVASPKWLDTVRNGNDFFELANSKRLLRIRNRWSSKASAIAAISYTVSNNIYEKNRDGSINKSSIIINDPLRLGGKNLWEFPNDEILFYIIHICNAKTVDRTVIHLLEQSQSKLSPQLNALILASRIVELKPDKVERKTISNILEALRTV